MKGPAGKAALGALLLLSALVCAAPAGAAFPGTNGKIAFATMRDEPDPAGCQAAGGCNWEIYSVNADGTGLQRLTNDPAADFAPAWSPDGRQIAFSRGGRLYKMRADGTEVTPLSDGTSQGAFGYNVAWSPDFARLAFERNGLWVANADATGQTQIGPSGTPKAGPREPSWSPDGARIAFASGPEFGPYDIYTINPDGAAQEQVTHLDIVDFPQYAAWPDWSPTGERIAFSSNKGATMSDPSRYDIYSVSRDGSDETRVTTTPGSEWSPDWSPDGTRFAFERDGDVYLAGVDGTNEVRLTAHPARDAEPDWQPVLPPYLRPAAAKKVVASLVVAYRQCTSPDALHGPPLAEPACSGPRQSSPRVTVGASSNGAPARFTGFVRLGVTAGDPGTPADEADLKLRASLTDVRCDPAATVCGAANATGPPDYPGELLARVSVRITDRHNLPHPGGPGPGTLEDFDYSFVVPCAPTGEEQGATCGADTTADALLPGLVREGARATWQLGQIEVLDGGADGDAGTPDGAEPFARQGVFVP